MKKNKNNKKANTNAAANTGKNTAGQAPEKPVMKESKGEKNASGILSPKSGKGLILRIVILLLIPYAFLWICGFIFDRWLRWYFMTTYIFIALCVLYLLAFVAIGFVIRNYCRTKKAN